MTDSDIRKNLILVLLILTSTLMTMSTDLYAPSLPYLPEYFGTTNELVKLTMSLWMMAYGGLLLIFGPLSERYGRRPVLVGAMAVFTLCSFLCTVATSIEYLIIARMIQGAAAGAEGVLVLSIIRDCFDQKGQVRAFSIYRAANAIPPIFTPILGAYIFLWFGWQANFILLTVIAGSVTVLLWKFLDESRSANTQVVSIRQIAADYWSLIRNRRFLSFAVIMSTTIAFLVVFATVVPFVLVQQLEHDAAVFGYFQGATMVAFIFGSIAANRMANMVSVSRLLSLGIGIVVLGAVLLSLVVLLEVESLVTLGITLAVMAFGHGPVLATTPPLAMSTSGAPTGASAAMLLTITSALASLTAVAEGAFSEGTSRSLATILAISSVIAVVAYLIAVRGQSADDLTPRSAQSG